MSAKFPYSPAINDGNFAMYLELVQVDRPSAIHQIFPGNQLIVGRCMDVDLPLSHDGLLSRRHFLILCRSESAVIRDLRSKNGTFLNQRRVHFARLRDGDYISAGGSGFRIKVCSNVSTDTRCKLNEGFAIQPSSSQHTFENSPGVG